MNRAERWILEAVCEAKSPIRALKGDGPQLWFNRKHHGLDTKGTADVLRALLRDKLIVLSPGHDAQLYDNEEELRRFVAVDYQGRLAKTTYYGLTAAGGAAWERVARPDWARFVDASFGTDPNDGEVICADSARAEEYVFSPYQDSPPLPNSVQRDRLEPWEATYWKTLLVGHRIRFLYDPEDSVGQGREGAARLAWLDEMNRWFTPDES